MLVLMFVSIHSYGQIFGKAAALVTTKGGLGGELAFGYKYGNHGLMLSYLTDNKQDNFYPNVSYVYKLNDLSFRAGLVWAEVEGNNMRSKYKTYIIGADYNFCYMNGELVDGNFYTGADLIQNVIFVKVGMRFIFVRKRDRTSNIVNSPNY